MFSTLDLKQIQQHGTPQEAAMRQQNIVNQNKINVNIVRPAMPADGVFVFNKEIIDAMLSNYSERIADKKIVKFVPASGAATRMFKELFSAMEELSNDKNFTNFEDSVSTFFENLSKFAFYKPLADSLKKDDLDIEKLLSEKNYLPILQHLLTEKGLNYGKYPKGLLPFHCYGEASRTALEEHLVEAAYYASENDDIARLHFTVSAEHLEAFKNHCQQVVPAYEKQFEVKYEIGFSTQNPSTDTLAFTANNKPFRGKDKKLVFRPGGHGSLIENLNNIDADIVVIKNIDNVMLDRYKRDTTVFKKLLICFLRCLEKRVFEYLEMFDAGACSQEDITKVEVFFQKILFINLDKAYQRKSLSAKQKYLYRFLNRPMRVCGMVYREDEPGGGPFWVRNSKGEVSLQIVETSEINLADPKQERHLKRSFFFNPVDAACFIKNHRGEAFHLPDYVDHSRYFVSEKSHEGKVLKAIENPGLWNGGMSDWITVFIAVPTSTFTPVKAVNDLLRGEHVWEK